MKQLSYNMTQAKKQYKEYYEDDFLKISNRISKVLEKERKRLLRKFSVLNGPVSVDIIEDAAKVGIEWFRKF